MTQFQHRLFIFLDEWLGVLLLVWLDHTHSPFFWWVFAAWVFMVYVVSYLSYWLKPWLALVDEDEDDLEPGDLG